MDIQCIYEASYSRRGFFTNLENEGYTLERKNGGIVGVSKDGQSKTFKELGLTQKDFEQLDLIQERVHKKVQQRLGRIEQKMGISKEKKPNRKDPCKGGIEDGPEPPKGPKRTIG